MVSKLTHVLVFAALCVWVFFVFSVERPTIGFHGDESHWIAAGRYFGTLVLNADWDSEAFEESYWTLTQPPLFRYLLGAGIWLQGYDLNQLNKPYKWSQDLSDNREKGRVPTWQTMQDARRVSKLFGIGAIAMLYVVALQLGNPVAGVVAALLVGASPYLREHFFHAMAESTFAFLLLLALALCLAAFRHPAPALGLRSAGPAGVALGLALSTKLTAALSMPALAIACLLRFIVGRHGRTSEIGSRSLAAYSPLLWGAIAGLVCWGLFVSLNPYLWANPPGRTADMFAHRQLEQRQQQNHTPKAAVWSVSDRPGLVLGHALVNRTWANSTFGVPVDVLLATLGLVSLGLVAGREWQSGMTVGPAGLFLLWLASYLVGISWGYALNWDRYVLPIFLIGALLSGVGLVWVAGAVARTTRRLIAARLRPSSVYARS